MTDFTETYGLEGAGRSYYSRSEHNPVSHAKQARLLKDTIEYKKEHTVAVNGELKKVLEQNRPSLTPPKPSPEKDFYTYLAAAYAKAFNAERDGVEMENTNYANLQELNLTESQCILQATTNAFNKQEGALKLDAEIQKYNAEMQQKASIINGVLIAFGIVLMVGTAAAGYLTGGAADELLPEEAELLAGGGAGDGALADTEELSLGAEVNEQVSAFEDMENIQNAASSSAETTVSGGTEGAASSTAGANTAKWLAEKAFKTLVRMAMAGALGSPMLMKGLVGVQLEGQYKELAGLQADVGGALQILNTNNMYQHFTQQMIKQEGSVVQEEITDAGEIIDTFQSVSSAIKQISYGLANAV